MKSRNHKGPAYGISRRYRSPMDAPAKTITGVVIVTVLLAVPLISFMPPVYKIIAGIFVGASTVTLVVAYFSHPIGYGMDPEALVLYFPFMRVRIPWRTVRDVRLDPGKGPYRALRTIGSGGVFGYLGRYWSPALGFHIRLVTDRNSVVVIDRRIPYCVSPDDPPKFVREAQEYLPEQDEDGPTPAARRIARSLADRMDERRVRRGTQGDGTPPETGEGGRPPGR